MKLLLASFVACALGHGTPTFPAMRPNPAMAHPPYSAPYGCPYCQGDRHACEDWSKKCSPPTPCMRATPNKTVPPAAFGRYKDVLHPDGHPWVDENGGQEPMTKWCPGSTLDLRYFIKADHNGVWRWEAQRTDGNETEAAFSNITDWRWANNDPNTRYYYSDGHSPLPAHECISAGEHDNETVPWANNIPHCRNEMFAETTFTLPKTLTPGRNVFRWYWYGGMTPEGQRVKGPEPGLFLSCVDVMVEDPKTCTPTTSSFSMVEARA